MRLPLQGGGGEQARQVAVSSDVVGPPPVRLLSQADILPLSGEERDVQFVTIGQLSSFIGRNASSAGMVARSL